MAFCTECGEKLGEGARFCAKCGTSVNAEQGIVNQAMAGTQAGYQEPPKIIVPQNKKNKLLTYALIAAPALFVVFILILIRVLLITSIAELERDIGKLAELEKLNKNKSINMSDYEEKKNMLEIHIWVGRRVKRQYELLILICFIAGLSIIAIATKLNLKGQRENNGKNILTAGFVYFICLGVGLPSAIMCFTAYSRMNK